MHLIVLLQPQCTHTQLLLLATVLVFHSLTAFVSSLPQVQTSHAALGPREDCHTNHCVCVCVCVQVVGGAHYPATPICLVSQALHAQTLVVSVGVFDC